MEKAVVLAREQRLKGRALTREQVRVREREMAAEKGKKRVRVNVRDLGLEFRKSLYL